MSLLTQKALYGISRPVIGTYTSAMLKMDIQTYAPLPKGAKIIAANHPSTTDPFFVAWVTQKQSHILIKDTLFNVPILGQYLRSSGHIEVKAGSGQEAIDSAVEYLKQGHTVIIFPEGSISPLSGGFHPARSGVARIALASGAPVIPVGIYLDRNRIRSIHTQVKGKDEVGYWYLRGPYNMTVGSPEAYNGDCNDWTRVREVSSRVMRRIMDLAYESQDRYIERPGIFNGTLETV
jgi:1-acyl-sn-glycerol-3-phosphate acyltransferase